MTTREVESWWWSVGTRLVPFLEVWSVFRRDDGTLEPDESGYGLRRERERLQGMAAAQRLQAILSEPRTIWRYS